MPASGKARGAGVGRAPISGRRAASDAEQRRRRRRAVVGGHQAQASEHGRARRPAARPHGSVSGSSSDQRASLVPVALPRRRARLRPAGRPRRPAIAASSAPRVAGRAGARSVRLDGGDQAELGDEPVVVGGQLAVHPAREGVGGELALELARRRPRASASLSAYHGKAQAAASRPAASATTWLLADEPRLRKAARYSWCHQICRSASSLCSKRSPTLGHSSSSRRIHTQLDAAGPRARCRWSSARRTGTGSAATRSAAARRRRSAYRSSPVSHQAVGEHGQVVVPRQLPDLLDVAGDRLVAVVDPEREPVAAAHGGRSPGRGTSPGRRCPARATPSTVQLAGQDPVGRGDHGRPAPARTTCAHGPTPAVVGERRAVVAQPAAAVRRGRPGAPGGAPSAGAGPRSTARRRPRPATSRAAAGRTSRAGPAHSVTGSPDGRLVPTASVARVVATSESQRDRHRRAASGPPRRTRSSSRALALVLPGERALDVLAARRPHRDPGEVVQPPVAAAAGDVERLLREAAAARRST